MDARPRLCPVTEMLHSRVISLLHAASLVSGLKWLALTFRLLNRQ